MNIEYSKDTKIKFIDQVMSIDSSVYAKELLGTYESIRARFEKNNDSYTLVYDNDSLVGYMCLFPITGRLYKSITDDKIFCDEDISSDDITDYCKDSNLFMISVAIKPEYQHGEAVIELVKGFKKFLADKKGRINSISAFTVSEAGERFLSGIGFCKISDLGNGKALYTMDSKEIRRFMGMEKEVMGYDSDRLWFIGTGVISACIPLIISGGVVIFYSSLSLFMITLVCSGIIMALYALKSRFGPAFYVSYVTTLAIAAILVNCAGMK